MVEPRLKLSLSRASFPPNLDVKLLNTSNSDVRLWDLENSWGWNSFTVFLKDKATGKIYVIKRKDREWTRNAPSWFSIRAGQIYETRLNLFDGWWNLPTGFDIERKPCLARVEISIDASQEAEKNQILVGTATSDWK
jgi:hypothetical protein